jgi:hypothetical protein
VPSRRAVEGAAAPASGGAAVSYTAELDAIDRRAEEESTARRALDEANAISGKVTSTDERVRLAIIRAQAYGTLGENERSCSELKRIEPVAKATSYAKSLGKMLANCP